MCDMKFQNLLLLGAVMLCMACTSSEEYSSSTSPPDQLWTVKVTATRDSVYAIEEDANATRALFVGGLTDRFLTAWDKGDVVQVYKGSTLVGTMTPDEEYWGTKTASLSGSLTGPFAANDELTLYVPSKAMDFIGQNGTLQSVSQKSFLTKTVSVVSAQNNILSLGNINMNHRSSYLRFLLTDENTGERLHPSHLEIHGITGGNAMLSKTESGVVTAGDLVLDMVTSDGEYPGEIYVSLQNSTEVGSTVTYRIKANVGDDVYVGPVSGQNQIRPSLGLGKLTNIRRKMRKTTPVSSLSVSSVASRTFTGYAQEPTGMTVMDGTTTLTSGTDYAFEYSSNVNVGEATVTVRGLADAGATCATKYLGTQDVHFNITKATPKIQMNNSTLELGYGSTPETRTVSRVYIDNNNNDTYEAAIDYDITSQCTVIYVSNNTGICSVDGSGVVTPVGTGSTTITVQVYAAANWNSVSTYYPVTVVAGVRNGNAVSNWSNGGSTPDKIYVE